MNAPPPGFPPNLRRAFALLGSLASVCAGLRRQKCPDGAAAGDGLGVLQPLSVDMPPGRGDLSEPWPCKMPGPLKRGGHGGWEGRGREPNKPSFSPY